MKILKQMKNKFMERIYCKMLDKTVFCYDYHKGKHGKQVYLLVMLNRKIIKMINMTKQVQALTKCISN